jgi:hypothetical protein
MLDRENTWIDEHIKLRDLTQKKIEKLEKKMKIQEDSKLGDWFKEWYKNLQSKAPDSAESIGWVLSALDLMNKMVARIKQLEGQNG